MRTVGSTSIFGLATVLLCGAAAIFVSCRAKAQVAAPTPPTEINLALNKPATASGSYGTAAGPEKAVDGDTLTSWNSGRYPPAYIEVDLQDAYTINGISIMLNQSPAGQTEFEAWTYDGIDSMLAARWSGATKMGSRLETRFQPLLEGVRKVRIRAVSSPSWVSFFEVTVAGYPQ